MKMYLISDNIDTWTGMRLAGVEGAVVHEKEELKAELDKVLADKTIGIVLLTERSASASVRSRVESKESSIHTAMPRMR